MEIGGSSSTGLTGAVASQAQRDPSLEKAARAFEAIFLRQMIGAMRGASLSEGLFDSSSTQQFRDMADSRVADQMAETSKFGIADLLMRQFAPKVPLTASTVMKSEFSIGEQKDDGQ